MSSLPLSPLATLRQIVLHAWEWLRLADTQVVAAQLDALQRNDWPDSDAGVAVAFAFSKPHGAELLLPGEVPAASSKAFIMRSTSAV